MRCQVPCFGSKTAIMQSDNRTNTSSLRRDDYERFYHALEHSGLQYYWPRMQPSTALKHPTHSDSLSDNAVYLCSEHPIFCARVLVLLSVPLQQLNKQEQLLLKGMLQVIPIKKNEYCIAWFNSRYPGACPTGTPRVLKSAGLPISESQNSVYCDIPAGIAAIIQWTPHSLLLLGTVFKTFMSAHNIDLNIPIVQSYSPSELAKNPALKREAYHDLLNFKSTIMQSMQT